MSDLDLKARELAVIQRQYELKNQQDVVKNQQDALENQRQKQALDLQRDKDAFDLQREKYLLDIQRGRDQLIADQNQLEADQNRLDLDKKAFEEVKRAFENKMLEASLFPPTDFKGSLCVESGPELELDGSGGIVGSCRSGCGCADGRREETNDDKNMTKLLQAKIENGNENETHNENENDIDEPNHDRTKLSVTIQAKIDHNQSLLDKLQIKLRHLKILSTQLQDDKDRHLTAVMALEGDRERLEEEREELYAELAASRQAVLNTRLNILDNTNLVELSNRLNKRAVTIEEMKSHGLVTQEESKQIALEMTDDDFVQLESRFVSRWPIVAFIKSQQPMTNDQVFNHVRVMNDDEFSTETAQFQQEYDKLNGRLAIFGNNISSIFPPAFIGHLVTMPDTEFRSKTNQLNLIKWNLSKSPGSLDLAQLNALMSLSEDELVARQDYLDYHDDTRPLLDSVITPCSTNFSEWGTSDDYPGIQWRFPSLCKSVSWCPKLFYNLLYILYPRDEATGKASQHHTHPKDPSITGDYPPLFPYCLQSDFDNGSIPRLSSNPKLFFSTPNIANGEWIQFHGPGTEIFDVAASSSVGGGSGFHLVLGGLCPKGKAGSWDFIDSEDAHTYTAAYQISIKWE